MITDATRTGIRAVLRDPGPRRQPMPGFEDGYHDIVHYILRCTYRIWEQRGLELIRTHYAPDARVITLGGETRTADAVISGTARTLRSFPDRRLMGEDVIWCQLPEGGYFSSHRIISRMTHMASGEFGAADGRVAHFRTVADCYVRANRIYLEWLARDNLAIALQLGKDPYRVAARAARSESRAFARWRVARARALLDGGARASETPAHASVPRSIEAWVQNRVSALNARNWSAFEATTDRALLASLPGHRTVRSAVGVAGYWEDLAGQFPDLRVVVDRVTRVQAGKGEVRIAVRWWGACTHRGHGRFGRASGAPVLLLGVSHFLVRNGIVAREWTVHDELAMLRQIAAWRRHS